MNALTQWQERVFSYITETIRTAGHAPTISEICQNNGIRWPRHACDILIALEKKGRIKRTLYAHRGITVVWVPGDRA